MKSSTGSFESAVAFAGAHTLAKRQSSPCLLLGRMLEMPRQTLPNLLFVEQCQFTLLCFAVMSLWTQEPQQSYNLFLPCFIPQELQKNNNKNSQTVLLDRP
jgi:hypothetical protein